MKFDVAVIGAGVVGAMISRELSRYQLSVCILEKEEDVAMGSSKANSGIVHAGFDAEVGSLKARLNVEGSKMMKSVAEELGVPYKRNGSLVVGFHADDMEKLEDLRRRGNENGVKRLQLIGKKQLFELEPHISESAVGALYAPTGAIICPYALTIAAVGNAMDNGVTLKLGFAVKKIASGDDGYEISSDHETVKATYIVNAAGLYSDEIAKLVGDDLFSIHPRKGQYLLLDKEYGDFSNHTIFRVPTKMGKGILISPTVDGNLLLGPTSENISDKEDFSSTMNGLQKILNEALVDMPDTPVRSVITSFCGLRATTDSGDFIIRPSAAKKRIVHVAGIDSPGLSASPAIARYVADMLEEDGLPMKARTDFIPIRASMHWYRDLTINKKNEVIQNDPRFGRIICRCETVSEGEIIDAIRTNPKATTVDGVKRRTRSGMGRCQGGFCAPYIVELLSKELEISFEDVTKFGGNSYINVGKTK